YSVFEHLDVNNQAAPVRCRWAITGLSSASCGAASSGGFVPTADIHPNG
ncbi:MAG: hypothetical protein ACI8W7_000549, partial [Gammaproteobacteria bacterium]